MEEAGDHAPVVLIAVVGVGQGVDDQQPGHVFLAVAPQGLAGRGDPRLLVAGRRPQSAPLPHQGKPEGVLQAGRIDPGGVGSRDPGEPPFQLVRLILPAGERDGLALGGHLGPESQHIRMRVDPGVALAAAAGDARRQLQGQEGLAAAGRSGEQGDAVRRQPVVHQPGPGQLRLAGPVPGPVLQRGGGLGLRSGPEPVPQFRFGGPVVGVGFQPGPGPPDVVNPVQGCGLTVQGHRSSPAAESWQPGGRFPSGAN